MKKSYFDGGLLQLIGWTILGAIVTIFTLGICYPWAACMIYRWETQHTVINGKRLYFNGTALQLFGSWIKWWFLTLITAGIYGFWVGIKLKKWIVKHTEFYGEDIIYKEIDWAKEAIQNKHSSPEITRPFPLTSKDLVHAGAMMEYCQCFELENGAPPDLCKKLFSAAECHIGSDKEVVMAFVALMDYTSVYENAGPCACVVSSTKVIIAGESAAKELPIQNVQPARIEATPAMSTIIFTCEGKPVRLGIVEQKAYTIQECFNRSVKACQDELGSAVSV